MDSKQIEDMLNAEKHFWFQGKRILIYHFLKRFFGNKKIKDTLDIGMGTGYILSSIESQYKEGIDISDTSIFIAKNRGLPNVYKVDDLLKYKSTHEIFDLIISTDVLEHIEKEEHFLELLKKHSNKNTICIISVPAFMFLWSEMDDAIGHHRRYTKKTLETLFKRNFNIHYIGYTNFFIFPLVFVTRLLRKYILKPNGGNNSWENDLIIPNNIINYLFISFYKIESLILTYVKLPFGTSVYIVISPKE